MPDLPTPKYPEQPSFQNRRSTYRNQEREGDYIRGESATALENTNSTSVQRYQVPTGVPLKAGVRCFNLSYDGIAVYWGVPDNTASYPWESAVLVRSGFGYPSTPSDGTILRSRSTTEPYSEYFLDSPLIPGRWYYYSVLLFIKDKWVVADKAHAVVPIYYGHGQEMYRLLPPFYQLQEETQWAGTENGILSRLLATVGYDLDLTRTLTEGIEQIYDMDRAPVPFLERLGKDNFGAEFYDKVGPARYRSFVAREKQLFNSRGTISGLRGTVEALSQYKTSVKNGVNEFLLRDDSDFSRSSGNWARMPYGISRFLLNEFSSTNTTFYGNLSNSYGSTLVGTGYESSNYGGVVAGYAIDNYGSINYGYSGISSLTGYHYGTYQQRLYGAGPYEPNNRIGLHTYRGSTSFTADSRGLFKNSIREYDDISPKQAFKEFDAGIQHAVDHLPPSLLFRGQPKIRGLLEINSSADEDIALTVGSGQKNVSTSVNGKQVADFQHLNPSTKGVPVDSGDNYYFSFWLYGLTGFSVNRGFNVTYGITWFDKNPLPDGFTQRLGASPYTDEVSIDGAFKEVTVIAVDRLLSKDLSGKTLSVVSGTGAGQSAIIHSNTTYDDRANTIVLKRKLQINPDAYSEIHVQTRKTLGFSDAFWGTDDTNSAFSSYAIVEPTNQTSALVTDQPINTWRRYSLSSIAPDSSRFAVPYVWIHSYGDNDYDFGGRFTDGGRFLISGAMFNKGQNKLVDSGRAYVPGNFMVMLNESPTPSTNLLGGPETMGQVL
jgi:hypothetical protein